MAASSGSRAGRAGPGWRGDMEGRPARASPRGGGSGSARARPPAPLVGAHRSATAGPVGVAGQGAASAHARQARTGSSLRATLPLRLGAPARPGRPGPGRASRSRASPEPKRCWGLGGARPAAAGGGRRRPAAARAMPMLCHTMRPARMLRPARVRTARIARAGERACARACACDARACV